MNFLYKTYIIELFSLKIKQVPAEVILHFCRNLFDVSVCFLDRKQISDCFHIDQDCFFHTGNQDKFVGSVDAVVDSLFFRSEGNDIFEGFCISTAADDYRFVFCIASYIGVGFVQGIYKRRFFREEQRSADLNDFNAAVFVFQFTFAHSAYIFFFQCYRNTDINGTGNYTVFGFYNSVAESQLAVLVCKFQSDTGTIAGGAEMGIIEFYKIIFKSGFCKALKGYACGIDTKGRCAGMGRNAFCVDGQFSVFFGYLVFL